MVIGTGRPSTYKRKNEPQPALLVDLPKQSAGKKSLPHDLMLSRPWASADGVISISRASNRSSNVPFRHPLNYMEGRELTKFDCAIRHDTHNQKNRAFRAVSA